MRALIVYESMYGNTRLVAEAIGNGLAPAEACGNGSAPCPIWLRPNRDVSRNLPALRTVLSGCRR
ncbi:flavodoxin family protein [Cryobacterium sp. Hh7]|uniref:flavodoxin family protein n=1 Tax=Cryobacterium sp. Hh7 TaxID=1259159 RepID=UPI00106B1BFA|nr:flavodoxin family protein [Cryobacterium sp. Hh7]TFD59420.1 flavodoxin family protein [Cryobacterium sp. Hh7]